MQKKAFKHILISSLQVKLTSWLLLIAISGFAQNIDQSSLRNKFQEVQNSKIQEKLFLHTDKDFYLVDEICWYKIYNVDAMLHRPLSISKVVYIEILDENNQPVLQEMNSLKEGYGNGSLLIPSFLTTGNYKIRAYTNWMKNFGSEFFFEKYIYIVNARQAPSKEASDQKDQIDINFFPEGGNLVEGYQSKIAFQVLKNGKGVVATGLIIDDIYDTLSHFSTYKFGLGNFHFRPKNGHSYKAIVTLEDKSVFIRDLPIVYQEGYVMSLNTLKNEEIEVKVQGNNSRKVYLFVHTRGINKFVESSQLINGEANFKIDISVLADGVSHFTLFNEEKEPVCERLYFKYPDHTFNIELSLSKRNHKKRDKVLLSLTSLNQASSNLSMAIYRIDSLQDVCEININNYLWLSSDLSPNIASPDYYFKNKDESAIENLMLTHGWRRFNWNNQLEKSFDFMPEYGGHLISGRITNANTKLPASRVRAFITVPNKHGQFNSTISNGEGLLKFDLNEFYNMGEIIVKTQGHPDSLYHIEIFDPFSKDYTSFQKNTKWEIESKTFLLKKAYTNVQVRNRFSNNLSNNYSIPQVDSNSFFLTPDISYELDNYVRFTSMEDVLREYVNRVIVSKTRNDFHLNVNNLDQNNIFPTEPIILLDGLPILKTNKLMTYDPLKVERLEILSQAYYLGSQHFSGILNFITYDGKLSNYQLDPYTTIIDYKGLSSQREFQTPIYETEQQKENRIPDFRTLLYWNPKIQTNSSESEDLSFYASDLSGKYIIVVQGITSDGKTGGEVVEFEVE